MESGTYDSYGLNILDVSTTSMNLAVGIRVGDISTDAGGSRTGF